MGYFADADELYAYIGGMFVELMQDPELEPRFQKADTVVQYVFTEPDATVTIKTLDGEPAQVDLGPTRLEPEVVMTMAADTAHRFWLGGLNVTVALAQGRMKAEGPVAKILKLVPLVKPAFPRYQAQLRDAGREDLLRVVDPPPVGAATGLR
jgi:hypothetical protein